MTGTLRIEASGPRNARTQPGTGLRWYKWADQEYVSVTTIRRLAGVPYGLHNWALGQVAAAAMKRASDVLQAEADPDEKRRKALLAVIRSEIRAAATVERDTAAALGTAVHRAADRGLLPDHPEVTDDMRGRLRQYHSWLEASHAEVLASEFQVFNLSVGYAGSADLLCRLPDGTIWLVDLKTGKSVYGEHALQLIAYLMGEFVGADDVVDEATTALLHDVSGMAILHLSDKGWSFRALRADRDTWAAFRGLHAFASWIRLHDRAEDVTVAERTAGQMTPTTTTTTETATATTGDDDGTQAAD